MATNLKFHGVGQFGMGILFYGKYCTGSPRSRKRNELMAGGTQLMIAAVSLPSPYGCRRNLPINWGKLIKTIGPTLQ